jgi:succinate dehydrogenase/fumarate reductase cytochrome b subunit
MELHIGNSLLGIIILFLDIWVIINVMQSSATANMKAFWIIIVLLLPIIGVVLWFLLGPRGR